MSVCGYGPYASVVHFTGRFVDIEHQLHVLDPLSHLDQSTSDDGAFRLWFDLVSIPRSRMVTLYAAGMLAIFIWASSALLSRMVVAVSPLFLDARRPLCSDLPHTSSPALVRLARTCCVVPRAYLAMSSTKV